MANKLDDFLSKKRESGPVLDLSKSLVTSTEEFRKLLDRVPDFKMRAEKIRPEDIRLKLGEPPAGKGHTSVRRRKKHQFRFRTGRKDIRGVEYTFADPVPKEMRKVSVREMARVPIDWKMLTTVRPKTQIEDDYYSRLVELAKLELKTETKDKRRFAFDTMIRKMKNKAGILEMRIVNCPDCGEDFCTGEACSKTSYENFTRIVNVPVKTVGKLPIVVDKQKIQRKKKKKVKAKSSQSKKTKSTK